MKPVEKSDHERYKLWKASHKCSLNYTGSSPNMEKYGAQNIFGRSVDKLGLYYTSFYGDGDSKAFPSVEKIYGPAKEMRKCECVGHYQKRVGTRLRKLKKKTKGLYRWQRTFNRYKNLHFTKLFWDRIETKCRKS